MSHEPKKRHDRSSKSKKKGATSAPHFRAMMMSQPEPELAFQPAQSSGKASAFVTEENISLKKVEEKPQPKPYPGEGLRDGWDDPVLTPVGLYYPLGPCLVRLGKNQLDQVLETLRGVFRTLSLHTKYHDSPISAECVSLDQVELEVVLLAARDNPDQIVVEVCRRDGDSYSFHLYAQQILSAVKDGASSPKPVVRPSWNFDQLHQAEKVGESSESVEEALEIAWGMFETERYDAQKLALESLMHMTDPNKSGLSASKSIAQRLLQPQSITQERLSKSVLEYAARDAGSAADAEQSSFESAAEADLAYLGLVVTSQSLQITSEAGNVDIKSFLEVCPVPGLVDSIIEKVSDVHEHPHHAFHAVKCLTALCNCSPAVRSRVSGANVEQAQLVGRSSHLALATVCERLLVGLQA